MKGILFKPDMIQAIVEGRKTQTRRVITPQPDCSHYQVYPPDPCHFTLGKEGVRAYCGKVVSRYHAGETVYIKEAHKLRVNGDYGLWEIQYKDGVIALSNCSVDAWTGDASYQWVAKWRSPLFMPEWAARHFITILAVRAERLQGISLKDIKAEGLVRKMPLGYTYWAGGYQAATDLHGEFAHLWDSINRKYPWESTPWVFPYEFELLNTESAGKHGEDS